MALELTGPVVQIILELARDYPDANCSEIARAVTDAVAAHPGNMSNAHASIHISASAILAATMGDPEA